MADADDEDSELFIPQDPAGSMEAAAKSLLDVERGEIEQLDGHVAEQRAVRMATGEVIVRAAGAARADLVVGSHQSGVLARLLVGSVSDEVVHSSHWPVLVVRGGEHAWPPAQVVVGFDHSPEAIRAAQLAASIAALYDDMAMTLVEAVPRSQTVEAPHLTFGDLLELEREHVERDADALSAVVHRQVQAAIVVDEPAAALLAPPVSATGPLLVAVGTRGLGPVRRFLLGSVSTKVLHAGHSPLLIVPRRAAPAQTSTRAA